MPSRNTIKTYIEDGFYHVYNRGVEKRVIFQDQQDYAVFLQYMAEYLQPRDEKKILEDLKSEKLTARDKERISRSLTRNNYSEQVVFLAYALMPNHFHFFLKQRTTNGMDNFMRSLFTRYVSYFNRKYKRIGSLCQGVYRAAVVDDDAYYVHISRYIHKQALISSKTGTKMNQPSSYPEYIGQRKTAWVHPEGILALFAESEKRFSYAQFVEEYEGPDLLPKDFFKEDE
jgi:putative transposase